MPSDKIKSKDLSYESTLPPLLQRLHDQKAGYGDQDRHERPIARPKRAKAHEDEDEPTVIDESGETVSKEELAKMTSAGGQNDQAEPLQEGGNVTGSVTNKDEALVSGALPDSGTSHQDQKLTDGTATKKRKVAKVIGGADPEDDETAPKGERDDSTVIQAKKRTKKKAKPVKLGFGEDDDG